MEEINDKQLGRAGAADVAQGPEGLLFTGDAVRNLSPAQLTSLGEFASRMFGVQMRQVHDVGRLLSTTVLAAETAEPELEPVRIDLDRTYRWAKGQGCSKPKIGRLINFISQTRTFYKQYDPSPDLRHDGNPEVDDLGEHGYPDLRSVYERLRRTNMSTTAWRKPAYRAEFMHPTEQEMRIMVEYINWAVEPDEPLDFTQAQESPYPWLRPETGQR